MWRELCFVGVLVAGIVARADRSLDSTPDQKVDQIVSIFENSTPEIQYSYIEALNDGRGYTAGRAGFTTATGDLVEVVHRYASLAPSAAAWPRLRAMLPRLEQLSAQESGSLVGLSALPSVWAALGDDDVFRRAQDLVTDDMYKAPARAACARLGLSSALSFLVIYDSIIQHGNGSDDDSLNALLARTSSSSLDEHAFIRSFLAVRRADLMNPSNHETAAEWRESVDRVDALLRLVNAGAWTLQSPLRVEVWGDTYAL